MDTMAGEIPESDKEFWGFDLNDMGPDSQVQTRITLDLIMAMVMLTLAISVPASLSGSKERLRLLISHHLLVRVALLLN